MNVFMQVSNFKRCEAMWRQYMMEHHQVIVPDSLTDSRPRKLLFEIMQDVKNNYAGEKNVDLRTLNNVSMNLARDVFLRKGGGYTQKTQQQSLDRDQIQPDGKQFIVGAPRPESTTRPRSPERRPQTTSSHQVADNPIDQDEVKRRLAGRDGDEFLATILRHVPTGPTGPTVPTVPTSTLVPPVPVALSSQTDMAKLVPDPYMERPSDAQTGKMRIHEAFTENAPAPVLVGTQSSNRGLSGLQSTPPQAIIEKYIIINGFDRFWQRNPLRYQYSVAVGGNQTDLLNRNLQHTYKNVASLQVTRLVIPMEIVPRTTFKGLDPSAITCATPNTTNMSTIPIIKGVYRHAASLSFQYVMLCIDGLDDVYDGTNDASRQAFCQLVYSTSYKAPNGRGFVIMEPMQDEKKLFSPTPLASLNRLSISILRPSGALFNNSTDDQTISMIQYEPFNRLYLRICVVNYFDLNEFFAGDSVIIQGYHAVQPSATFGSSWKPDKTASYTALNAYINRSEGHEIVELGLANNSGFFKSFCIMAPGAFDFVHGSVALDTASIAAIVEMNQTTFPCPDVPFGGALLNMSLQNVVTFKVGLIEGDGQMGN